MTLLIFDSEVILFTGRKGEQKNLEVSNNKKYQFPESPIGNNLEASGTEI